jgi:hypothetical protein
MVSSLHETARHDGSMSWNYAQDGAFADSKLGVIGWGWNVFIQGNALRVLSRYADGRGFDDAMPLARGLKNFLLQEKFWKPDGAPKAVVPYERAQFAGHHHSYTAALMGLLRYAEATNDRQVAEFVRAGYEFLRGFGIARIGMFGEMCTTGDMTFLAGYNLTPNFSLQFGYDLLWAGGVATATRQFNLDNIRPNSIDAGGQIFYMGFSGGIQGSW